MPELPDVAVQERYLRDQAMRRPVERTEVRDARLLAGVTAAALGRRLKGHPFTETRRHGKHLLVRAGTGGWLALHFGMTGYLDCREEGQPDPDHAGVVLHLAGGRRLGVVSRRKLGEVAWADDPQAFVRDRELGPDLLDRDLGTAALSERIAVATLPRGWLLPHREEGAACPHGCGGKVRRRTVAGRPTYPCPRCQSRQS